MTAMVVAALVAAPVAAWAAQRGDYRGRTTAGGAVTFRVAGNFVTRMAVGAHTVRCEDGRRFRFAVRPDGERLTIRADRFRIEVFQREGALTAAGSGRFDGSRARGTVAIVALVNDAGRVDPNDPDASFCQSRELRWSARRR